MLTRDEKSYIKNKVVFDAFLVCSELDNKCKEITAQKGEKIKEFLLAQPNVKELIDNFKKIAKDEITIKASQLFKCCELYVDCCSKSSNITLSNLFLTKAEEKEIDKFDKQLDKLSSIREFIRYHLDTYCERYFLEFSYKDIKKENKLKEIDKLINKIVSDLLQQST